MFARIKRFFTIFRILRQEAREDQEIYSELNLDKMGDLAAAAVPKPRGEAQADRVVYQLIPGKEDCVEEIAQVEAQQRILEESKVEYDNPCDRFTNHNKEAEVRLEEHDQKFRS